MNSGIHAAARAAYVAHRDARVAGASREEATRAAMQAWDATVDNDAREDDDDV